jgi:hypothetical protein
MEHIHGPGEEYLAFLRVSKHLRGEIIRPAVIPNENVHGTTYEFPGYELVHVPQGVKIFTDPELVQMPSGGGASAATLSENISKGTSQLKSLISLFQLVFSAVILWRVRGNQLDTNGYATFSLSVAPYAVMTAANLFANVISPQYQTMFIVRNEVLEEAESLYGMKISGSVAELRCMPCSCSPGKPDLHLPLRFDGSGACFAVLKEEEEEEALDSHGEPTFPLKIVSPDGAIRGGLLPSKQVTIPPHANSVQDVQSSWQLMAADIGSL